MQEPVERLSLDGDEIGKGQGLVEVGERVPLPSCGASRQDLAPRGAWRPEAEAARARQSQGTEFRGGSAERHGNQTA